MRTVVTVLAVSVLATGCQAPNTPPIQRTDINTPGRTDTLPYSNAVMVGNTLYLSGRIGIDPATGQPPEELEAEIRLVLDGMRDQLAGVGMTMDDLVTVQVFCPDLTLYDQFNAVYRTYFVEHLPARAFVGSGPLLRGGHFEVQGIAQRVVAGG